MLFLKFDEGDRVFPGVQARGSHELASSPKPCQGTRLVPGLQDRASALTQKQYKTLKMDVSCPSAVSIVVSAHDSRFFKEQTSCFFNQIF